MSILSKLHTMEPGCSVVLGEVLPGVVPDKLVMQLDAIKGKNYFVTMTFMGVLVKQVVFYDDNGVLMEVPQCKK